MRYTTKIEAEKATLEFIEKNEITFDNVTNYHKLDLMLQHVVDCGFKAGILPSCNNTDVVYNYEFKMNNRLKAVLGRYDFNKKLIELSMSYFKYGSLVHIVQTLMHEFCHHATYHVLGNGYNDGDVIFESLIKSCNSKSTRTTKVDFSKHVYKADCGCILTKHVKRDYSGYVCSEHKDSEIHYVGFLSAKEIEELKTMAKNSL